MFAFLSLLQQTTSCGSGWRWTLWWISSLCHQCSCRCILTGAGWVSLYSSLFPILSLLFPLLSSSTLKENSQCSSRVMSKREKDQTGRSQAGVMMVTRPKQKLEWLILLKWRLIPGFQSCCHILYPEWLRIAQKCHLMDRQVSLQNKHAGWREARKGEGDTGLGLSQGWGHLSQSSIYEKGRY